jgi:hypothetical protein
MTPLLDLGWAKSTSPNGPGEEFAVWAGTRPLHPISNCSLRINQLSPHGATGIDPDFGLAPISTQAATLRRLLATE